MNARAWAVGAAVLAVAVALVSLMPDDPAAWFLLGLASGLVGVVANWSLTKYVGCRRCASEAWP